MKNDSKKKPIRGNQSFTRIVPLKDGAVCPGLKRHYRNCAREVVGYLDSLAANDAERFVWPSVPTIVKHCNLRRKIKKPYRQRQVEYVLNFLRKQLILSEQLERVRGGAVRQGWILSHHDAVTVVENDCCDFQGQCHWEREIETAKDSTGQYQVVKIGPVVHPSVRPESPSVRGSVRPKAPSVRGSVRLEHRTIALQTSETENSYKNESAPSLLSLSEPIEPPPPTQTGALQTSAYQKPVEEVAKSPTTKGKHDYTKLKKFVADNFELYGALSKKNGLAMNQLVGTHGVETVLAALNSFDNRSQGFGGLKNVWALFFSEAAQHIAHAKRKQQSSQQRRTSQSSIDKGKKMCAEMIAEMRAEKAHPFSEEEIAKQEKTFAGFFSDSWLKDGIAIDSVIEQMRMTLYAEWRTRSERLSVVESGTIEDYL
jgi:hypothetical protein